MSASSCSLYDLSFLIALQIAGAGFVEGLQTDEMRQIVIQMTKICGNNFTVSVRSVSVRFNFAISTADQEMQAKILHMLLSGFKKSTVQLECTIALPNLLLLVCKRAGELFSRLTPKSRQQQPSIVAATYSPDASAVELRGCYLSKGKFWACHEGSEHVEYLAELTSHLGIVAGADWAEVRSTKMSGEQQLFCNQCTAYSCWLQPGMLMCLTLCLLAQHTHAGSRCVVFFNMRAMLLTPLGPFGWCKS